jgi:hypothetical protein
MRITTTAHLNFRGNAREALEFYQSVFGGEITTITYGDFGMPKELPEARKVVLTIIGHLFERRDFHEQFFSSDMPPADRQRLKSSLTSRCRFASSPQGSQRSTAMVTTLLRISVLVLTCADILA